MTTQARGCGYRVKGGIYLEVPSSPKGRPVEDFILCPPRKVTHHWLRRAGVSPQGIHLVDWADGSQVAMDWIGSNHYATPARWVEEVKRMGISRRMSSLTDFSKLSPATRLVVIHERAWIDLTEEYHKDRPQYNSARTQPWCPRNVAVHRDLPTVECCAGYWWEDEEGEGLNDPAVGPRGVMVEMPSFSFRACRRPQTGERLDPIPAPTYHPAIFASFPVGRLVVVRDPERGSHTKALERARKARLDVSLEDS